MPYVSEPERRAIAAGAKPRTAGQLNYVLTLAALEYLAGKELTYAAMNEVMGAFESAKQEFYRRAVTPYEDRKAAANGDVYPAHLA